MLLINKKNFIRSKFQLIFTYLQPRVCWLNCANIWSFLEYSIDSDSEILLERPRIID